MDYLRCGNRPYPARDMRVTALVLSQRRIRRYFVLPLKAAGKQRDLSHVRFTCGLGIILMPVLAAVIVWKAEQIRSFLMMVPSDAAMLAAAGMICLLVSVNDMTAPSVSLEGKNLWIAQSLPVSGRQVLTAKRNMHLLLTLIPAIPLLAAVEWLLRPELSGAVLIPAAVILFVILTAQAGLALNLKMPNLQWSSETIPMKQSAPTVFTMFGSWGILAALAVLYAVFCQLPTT